MADMAEQTSFPLQGSSPERVMETLRSLQRDDLPTHGARNFRPVYYVDDGVLDLINAASAAVAEQNMLYAGASFPSLRRIKRELIDMGLDLLQGPPGAGGQLTIGGSESNFMLVKTARDWFSAHPERAPFEMVLAHTAHPSLEKAAAMLGVAVRRLGHSDGYHADVAGMAELITSNTILMVGSAPPAAYAQTDPIAELASVAARHQLWFHVDGCMGGFFLPFARALGAPIPEFDFAVPGVWSISADLHKFGYAPKGVSLLLFRDAAMERYATFRFENWPFGEYATSGVAGSRPAAPIVAAWSVIRHLGRTGYLRVTERLLALKRRLIDGVAAIEGLRILGRPDAAHVFIAADGFDIFAVEEELTARGYAVSRAWLPDSIQLWVNVVQEELMDAFLRELAEITASVRAERRVSADRTATYAT